MMIIMCSDAFSTLIGATDSIRFMGASTGATGSVEAIQGSNIFFSVVLSSPDRSS